MIKKIRTALIIAASGLLVACGGPDVRELEDGDKIAVLGGDLVLGTGGKDVNFPQEMGSFIGTWVVNMGSHGETSDLTLSRVDSILKNEIPSHIMIVVGDEDMKKGIDDSVIEANISEIINKAKVFSVVPIVVGLPRPVTPNTNLSLVDAPFYKNVANKHNVVYIDNAISVVLDRNEFKSNTNYLIGEGYVEVAKNLSLKMKDLGYIKEVKF